MGVLDKLRDARTAIADHDAAKTAEEAERREAERDPAVVEAAAMLGMKEAEVVAVDEADEGLVITTHDGVRLVLVSPDNPDAAGKVGLMLLAKPKADMVTDFPVYARGEPAEPAPELGADDATDTTAEEPTGDKPLDKQTKKELLDTIDQLSAAGAEIEVPPKATNADLVALIEGAS